MDPKFFLLKKKQVGLTQCNDRLVIRIQTILVLEAFINVRVDELNNLKHKTFRDILIDDIGDEIPESEDNIVENYKARNTNQFI